MQVRGEHVQGMVALPKALEIFIQDFLGKLGVLARSTHILTIADLDDNFVEQLFLLSRPYLFVVVRYLAVITGLFCVVLFKRLVKELVIDLLYRLVDVGDIQILLLPSTLSAVKLRSLWVRQPSPKVALTLLTIKSTSFVLPFRRKFCLRVKRAYHWFCSIRAKPVIQQQRTAKQYIGLSDTARSG